MKKISNEVKVGVVALITIIVFIWLYNFLKGKDFFSSTAFYYSVYDKIGGLAESSPVEINGYKVGVVQAIDFIDATSGKLLVTFSVTKDFKLPLNTVAEIVPVSIIAGMKAQFIYGDGPGFYSDGDTIPGRLSESLLTSFENEFVPLKRKIDDLLDVLDSVIISVNDVMDSDFKNKLSGTVSNLHSATKSLDNIMSTREKEIGAAIENVTRFTKMLSDNSEKIGKSISNLESITDTIASSDLYASVLELKTTLEKTSILMGNLNEGKGSAGQLFTNDSLYNNLSSSLGSLDLLLRDMKANPKRYVHFSLFGKKETPSE